MRHEPIEVYTRCDECNKALPGRWHLVGGRVLCDECMEEETKG